MTSYAALPRRQHGLSCAALGTPTVTPRRAKKSAFVLNVLAGFFIPFVGMALPTLRGDFPLAELVQFTAGIVFGEGLAIALVLLFVPDRNPFRAPSGAKKRA